MPASLVTALSAGLLVLLSACRQPDGETSFDTIIRGGTVYDGLGGPGIQADVGIVDDRIAKIGDLRAATADTVVDASGQAVSPGFINMLSWALLDLIFDGRGMSDLKQGVTLQVFGEGLSLGPTSDALLEHMEAMGGVSVPFLPWRTLGQSLWLMELKGVSPNIASFVGGANLRMKHLGFSDRAATAEEVEAMREDMRVAMEEGAMGLGTSLIYPPGRFAATEDLIALAEVVAEYGGMYTSHMRSEGVQLLEGIDEVIRIARETGVTANVYHLKAAGVPNWPKMDIALEKIEAARAEGLAVTADMYPYVAGGTGLEATLPPSLQEGGYDAMKARILDPELRPQIIEAMTTPTDDWEQLFLEAGGGENVLVMGLISEKNRALSGKSLKEIAAQRGSSEPDTILDLIVEEEGRIFTVYFMMTEDNLVKQIRKPWVAINSDAQAVAREVDASQLHPRAFGTFSRVLAKFVREDKIISLPEAIRRMTSLPADNLKLSDRGRLQPGAFADVVVFDPDQIQDNATYEKPNQYASGVAHVFVNGGHVLKDGEHNDVYSGRFVRGPGYRD
ncbi:MAG: D-aminoacylase [Pseudomonadota bacterium]